jgi:hypothetical protein
MHLIQSHPIRIHLTGEQSMKNHIILVALFLLAACTPLPGDTGVLAGEVSIGPLQPVFREGMPVPTPAPEEYATRKILVLSANGRREIARVSIDPDGTYQVILPVGRYQVDIAGSGIDRGIDLPAAIEIFKDQTTHLDIDIDTGIR